MLEILVIIFGLVTLVRGKFMLSRQRELVGGRARIVGAILLSYLFFSFLSGIVLAIVGGEAAVEGWAPIVISIIWLVIVIIVARITAGRLYAAQEAERLQVEHGYAPYEEEADPNNPYRAPNG